MTHLSSTAVSPGSSLRSRLGDFGRALRSRPGLIVLGAATLALGAGLNWSWLVVAGIAPLLVSVLPCVAMCTLGLCMNRMTGRTKEGAPTGTLPDSNAPSAALHQTGSACCSAARGGDRISADAS